MMSAYFVVASAICVFLFLSRNVMINACDKLLQDNINQIKKEYDDLNNKYQESLEEFDNLLISLQDTRKHYSQAISDFLEEFKTLQKNKKLALKKYFDKKSLALDTYLEKSYVNFQDDLYRELKGRIIEYFNSLNIDYAKTHTAIMKTAFKV